MKILIVTFLLMWPVASLAKDVSGSTYLEICKEVDEDGVSAPGEAGLKKNICMFYTKGVLSGVLVGFAQGVATGFLSGAEASYKVMDVEVDGDARLEFYNVGVKIAPQLMEKKQSFLFCSEGIKSTTTFVRIAYKYIKDNPVENETDAAILLKRAWNKALPLPCE